MRKILPVPAILAFSVAAVFLAACSDSEGQDSSSAARQAPAAVRVGVVTPKKENVPYRHELPGRVVAYETAEIRPQVDGMVMKRVFTEGREVKEGDVLYQLDPMKFEAAKAAAEAAVEKAQASVANAQGKYDRSAQLAKTNAVSEQTVEDANATLRQAQADAAAAKADLQTAQISLDYATIKAPISGLIGKSTVSTGALVTANQTTALATIRRLDPVYVDLVDSSANLLRLRAKVRAGDLGRDKKGPPPVTLQLEDGSKFDVTGKMNLAEFNVSQSTGTFSLRATFDNPNRTLLPGMFVRATVDLGDTPNAWLAPEQAVSRDSAGDATAYVVDKDDKIATRILSTDRIYENSWVVTAGIEDGDRIVVDGLQYISNGAKVEPVPVTVNPDGTVNDGEATSSTAPVDGSKAETTAESKSDTTERAR